MMIHTKRHYNLYLSPQASPSLRTFPTLLQTTSSRALSPPVLQMPRSFCFLSNNRAVALNGRSSVGKRHSFRTTNPGKPVHPPFSPCSVPPPQHHCLGPHSQCPKDPVCHRSHPTLLRWPSPSACISPPPLTGHNRVPHLNPSGR